MRVGAGSECVGDAGIGVWRRGVEPQGAREGNISFPFIEVGFDD